MVLSGGRLFPVYMPASHFVSRNFYEDYALHLNKRPAVGTANLMYEKKKNKTKNTCVHYAKQVLIAR